MIIFIIFQSNYREPILWKYVCDDIFRANKVSLEKPSILYLVFITPLIDITGWSLCSLAWDFISTYLPFYQISKDLSLGCKEIQPVHSEGDKSWEFFRRNDAKAETPVLWPPHAKSWLSGKDSDAGRDWGQEEKGATEDEMAGWHRWLDGCDFEWTPGFGDGQGGLACCDPWGRKESDTT